MYIYLYIYMAGVVSDTRVCFLRKPFAKRSPKRLKPFAGQAKPSGDRWLALPVQTCGRQPRVAEAGSSPRHSRSEGPTCCEWRDLQTPVWGSTTETAAAAAAAAAPG